MAHLQLVSVWCFLFRCYRWLTCNDLSVHAWRNDNDRNFCFCYFFCLSQWIFVIFAVLTEPCSVKRSIIGFILVFSLVSCGPAVTTYFCPDPSGGTSSSADHGSSNRAELYSPDAPSGHKPFVLSADRRWVHTVLSSTALCTEYTKLHIIIYYFNLYKHRSFYGGRVSVFVHLCSLAAPCAPLLPIPLSYNLVLPEDKSKQTMFI